MTESIAHPKYRLVGFIILQSSNNCAENAPDDSVERVHFSVMPTQTNHPIA
jgi:hypothetical protein